MLKSTAPGPQEPEGDYDELLQEMIKNVEPEATDEFATSFAREHIKELVERHINDFGGEFRYRFGKEYRWLNVRLMRDDLLNEDEAVYSSVRWRLKSEGAGASAADGAGTAGSTRKRNREICSSPHCRMISSLLNGIIGMAELAELHKDDCMQVKEYIRKIHTAGR